MPEDEEEGSESEFGQKGMALKKMMKVARTKPLSFSFVPGSGDKEATFGLHRRKKPEVMGKSMRKEAEQPKVAFGTAKLEGKELVLTCTKVVPGMEKKLQKTLRKEKLALTVKVVEGGGGDNA